MPLYFHAFNARLRNEIGRLVYRSASMALVASVLRWLVLANYRRPVAQREPLAWIVRGRHVECRMGDRDAG
jgi:hypothetical protein